LNQSLTQWLMSEAPTSRRQAVLGNLYHRFVAIISNPAALAGLLIVAVLILMAILAPQLAGGISPIEQNLASRLRHPPPATGSAPTSWAATFMRARFMARG
jgi:peptide/nickel transport system permease protein